MRAMKSKANDERRPAQASLIENSQMNKYLLCTVVGSRVSIIIASIFWVSAIWPSRFSATWPYVILAGPQRI